MIPKTIWKTAKNYLMKILPIDVVTQGDSGKCPKEAGSVSEDPGKCHSKGDLTDVSDSMDDCPGGRKVPKESSDMDVVTTEEINEMAKSVDKAFEGECHSECDRFDCEDSDPTQAKASSWADQVTNASFPGTRIPNGVKPQSGEGANPSPQKLRGRKDLDQGFVIRRKTHWTVLE